MSNARLRNMSWVYDHAMAIGGQKTGLAYGMFTIGEVVTALGFSKNTVKSHVKALVELGHVREVVLTKKLTVYKIAGMKIAYQEKTK